jgi:YggT family protein
VTNLGSVVSAVGGFYGFLIIAYVLMSWLPMNGGIVQDIHGVLGSLVEPYLGLFRRFIPPMGGMDFSPIIAIVLLQFLVRGLAGLLS